MASNFDADNDAIFGKDLRVYSPRTTMTTPDYRAALAELIEAVDRLLGQGESPANPGSRLILTVHVEDLGAIADRARALLAAPEAVGVADEEIRDMMIKHDVAYIVDSKYEGPRYLRARTEEHQVFAVVREAIARSRFAHAAPVPVGERPWERDGWCDQEGCCWWWDTVAMQWSWRTLAGARLVEVTLSLPHWSLPLPGDQP
jgi:hypothetical protein